MHARRTPLLVIAGSALLAAFSSDLQGRQDDPETVRRRARHIVDGGGYQDRLPLDSEGQGEGSGKKLNPFRHEEPREPLVAPSLEVGAMLGRVFLYVIGGAALLVLAVFIISILRDRRAAPEGKGEGASPEKGKPKAEEIVQTAPHPAAAPQDWLRRADELAGAGQLPEAVHCLMLGAIHHLAQGSRKFPASCATSRELLRFFQLEESRRAAFARLVQNVERAIFADRPVSPADFDESRAHALQFIPERNA